MSLVLGKEDSPPIVRQIKSLDESSTMAGVDTEDWTIASSKCKECKTKVCLLQAVIKYFQTDDDLTFYDMSIKVAGWPTVLRSNRMDIARGSQTLRDIEQMSPNHNICLPEDTNFHALLWVLVGCTSASALPLIKVIPPTTEMLEVVSTLYLMEQYCCHEHVITPLRKILHSVDPRKANMDITVYLRIFRYAIRHDKELLVVACGHICNALRDAKDTNLATAAVTQLSELELRLLTYYTYFTLSNRDAAWKALLYPKPATATPEAMQTTTGVLTPKE